MATAIHIADTTIEILNKQAENEIMAFFVPCCPGCDIRCVTSRCDAIERVYNMHVESSVCDFEYMHILTERRRICIIEERQRNIEERQRIVEQYITSIGQYTEEDPQLQAAIDASEAEVVKSRPAPKEVIDRCTVDSKVPTGMDDICAICQSNFEEDEDTTCLQCTHMFHSGCIMPWLEKCHKTCPICRVPIDHDDSGSISATIVTAIEPESEPEPQPQPEPESEPEPSATEASDTD